jgi:acetolactate synthase small subunit
MCLIFNYLIITICAQGTRVFAVAKRQWALLPVLTIDRLVPSDIEKELVFVGFIACADQVRSEVHAAIEECRVRFIKLPSLAGVCCQVWLVFTERGHLRQTRFR